MYKTLMLPRAKEDIREASKWYNKQQQGLGKRFTKQIRDSVALIKHNPYAFNIRYKEVRTAIVRVFPYMIHYIIEEENKRIVIIAVFHTSLYPGRWKER